MKNIFLSGSHINQFTTEGYLKINDFLPLPLLEKLKTFFKSEMDLDSNNEGKAFYANKGKKYVPNLDNICNKKDLSCLELLGYPPILQIGQQICGDDFFMIQEFAVMKNLGDELPVL